MIREIIQTLLTTDSTLTDLVGDRVAQGSSVESFPGRPFIIHNIMPGGVVDERLGRTHYIQVWVHDEPGDYGLIDTILERVTYLFERQAPTGDLLEIRWLEDSLDTMDDGFGTICRFSRYQSTHTTLERIDPWN